MGLLNQHRLSKGDVLKSNRLMAAVSFIYFNQQKGGDQQKGHVISLLFKKLR